MSRKGRMLRKKKKDEIEAKEQGLRDAFSRKINLRKRNKTEDIEVFLSGKNDTFHPKHPFRKIISYREDRKRTISSMRPEYKDALRKILYYAFDLEMMNNENYAKALIEIAHYHDLWIRPIETWKSTTHNRDRQFASLLRWLFVQYDMPFFMDSVWYDRDSFNWILWYIEIGMGMSSYKVLKEKTGLTRKMAHYFMKAPNGITVKQAIRWAQVMGYGGDERIAHAIISCNIINRSYSEFWASFIHLIVRNPIMDLQQIGPMVDYLGNQIAEDINYSIKGRTIDSILKRTEEWHQHLTKEKKIKGQTWDGIALPNWKLIEGKKKDIEPDEKYLGEKQTLYTITQILSGNALSAEGRAMRHYVYSYTNACISGRSSIWSLKKDQSEQGRRIERHLVTIEVDNNNRSVVQAKGYCNRSPDPKEKMLIHKWANEFDLSISNYGLR